MMLQRFISSGALLVLLIGCTPIAMDVEALFTVQNNSELPICYAVGRYYPDTMISKDTRIVTLEANKSKRVGVGERDMERFFESLPRDTVSIFFLDPDTVKKYSLEKINEEYMILERRDLSYWDLIGNNSKVSFP